MVLKDGKRVAVVSGGNRGLGLASARRLAQLGFRVVLGARNAHKGEIAAEMLCAQGLDVLACGSLDVTREDSVAQLGEFVRSRCGRVDVLINNAGVLLDGNVEDGQGASVFSSSLDALRKTMEVNLYGPLRLAQELVPLMRQQNYGRVVNVSSGMGQLSEMGGRFPAYRMSKTALNALTRILSAELTGHNVLVNSICPGWVRTDMGGPNAERSPEQAVEGIVWAATLEDNGPTGGFFRDGQPIAW